MVIPITALIIAASASLGGASGMLMTLESTIRATVTGVIDFVSHLF